MRLCQTLLGDLQFFDVVVAVRTAAAASASSVSAAAMFAAARCAAAPDCLCRRSRVGGLLGQFGIARYLQDASHFGKRSSEPFHAEA
jgi:hypothetical protein